MYKSDSLRKKESKNLTDRKTYSNAYVGKLFDSIAHRYDFLNHFLSFGIDKYWRKKAIAALAGVKTDFMLDIATGTGDLAIAATHLPHEKIIGIDISKNMLRLAEEKVKKKGLHNRIFFQEGTGELLPFPEETFDATMVAFGVRNFENLRDGLAEMHRVLKKNGVALILEFSKPRSFLFSRLFSFYFKIILPFVGGQISNHRKAYHYLPDTVMEFPDREDFSLLLRNSGFNKVSFQPLTFGIVTLYLAEK